VRVGGLAVRANSAVVENEQPKAPLRSTDITNDVDVAEVIRKLPDVR